MLILDKPRALDRMVYLSDRKGNAVPTEFLRSTPLRWSVDAGGRRALTGEVVLRPSVFVESPAPTRQQERERDRRVTQRESQRVATGIAISLIPAVTPG